MWVTKLLISPVKKRIFCPKTTKLGPKLAFLVNLGQAMKAYLVPCWWVGWWLWRAGCISQDTYLLYFLPVMPSFPPISTTTERENFLYSLLYKRRLLLEYEYFGWKLQNRCPLNINSPDKAIAVSNGHHRIKNHS